MFRSIISKKMLYLAVSVTFVAIGLLGIKLSRAGYESAEYSVVESDGIFEVRQYPDLMLASTDMRFQSQGSDGSFMRLFGYISGRNVSEQKVAMTTPVFMEQENDKVEGQMGFVIPKDVVAEGVPEPSGSEVHIRKRDGGRFAVIRFSGKLDEKSANEAEARLREWIETKGLTGHESSEAAGYDPPFTPGPLRRNEVLIRLMQPAKTPRRSEPTSFPNG